MTYLINKFKGIFFKDTMIDSDPVYRFFFETSSGERKKVYDKALRGAQAEQERISALAREKVRA